MRQGPFLRIDIPTFINEHGLLDMLNVCQEHVLYTDVDVVFANKITKKDIRLLSNSVGQGMGLLIHVIAQQAWNTILCVMKSGFAALM